MENSSSDPEITPPGGTPYAERVRKLLNENKRLNNLILKVQRDNDSLLNKLDRWKQYYTSAMNALRENSALKDQVHRLAELAAAHGAYAGDIEEILGHDNIRTA